MNILLIDDETEVTSVVQAFLEENGSSCTCSSFESFPRGDFQYDLVIVDMMNGGIEASSGESGQKIIDRIWRANFCPIIIYSANPSLAHVEKHPLIAKVCKGSNSLEQILAVVKRMSPFVAAKQSIAQHVDHVLRKLLQHTVPLFFCDFDCEKALSPEDEKKSNDKINEVFPRIIRRQIAAVFDSGYNSEKLQPYEQYLFPPIGDDWLQGDVIQHKEEKSFLLVLTPSCDLVRHNGKCKTRSVLCAKCGPFDKECINKFFHYSLKCKGCKQCKSCDLDFAKCSAQRLAIQHDEEKKQLISLLNSGLVGDYYFLPALAGKIENMLADLKDLYVFATNEMNNYERIVSIDSPYREKLNEAFIRTVGRVGPPDRDFDDFASTYIHSGAK